MKKIFAVIVFLFLILPCQALEPDEVNVLSLDGGGIKSLITLKVLAYIEAQTGKKTGEFFDYIAGTSSGGMLALYLTLPSDDNPNLPRYSASDVIELLQDDSRKIFQPKISTKFLSKPAVQLFNTPYRISTMTDMTDNRFKDYQMKDSTNNIFVLTFDTETNQPVCFTSYDSSYNDAPMSMVAAATSVAPFYFSPITYFDKSFNKNRTLIDGGLVAKNPSVFAYQEAKKLFPDKKINLLSLGAGYQEKSGYTYEKLKNWGFLKYSLPTYTFMLDGVTNTNHIYMDDLQKIDKNYKYYRFQPSLCKNDGFDNKPDNTSQENFSILLKIGENYVNQIKPQLDEMIKELNYTKL